MGDLTYKVRMSLELDVPKEIDSRGECQWFVYKKLKTIMKDDACDVLDDFAEMLEWSGIKWSMELVDE
jgi:hypothetical protein